MNHKPGTIHSLIGSFGFSVPPVPPRSELIDEEDDAAASSAFHDDDSQAEDVGEDKEVTFYSSSPVKAVPDVVSKWKSLCDFPRPDS